MGQLCSVPKPPIDIITNVNGNRCCFDSHCTESCCIDTKFFCCLVVKSEKEIDKKILK